MLWRESLVRKGCTVDWIARSEEFLASNPDVFEILKPLAVFEFVWSMRFLADRAEASPNDRTYGPLQAYLERLLSSNPNRLSDIISLAASWRAGPDMSGQSAEAVLTPLARLLDVELVKNRAREMKSRGAAVGTWPDIVEQFVGYLN